MPEVESKDGMFHHKVSPGDFSEFLQGVKNMLELDFLLKKFLAGVEGADGRLYKSDEIKQLIIKQIGSLEKRGWIDEAALRACNPFLAENFKGKIYQMYLDDFAQRSMDA